MPGIGKLFAAITNCIIIISLVLSTFVFYEGSTVRAASYTVVVNPGVEHQTWEGWGTTLAWWANTVGDASDTIKNQYADRLFSLDSGLGFNIIRYNIGGGENPAYPDHMEYRARIPGFKASATSAYDWNQDAKQRWFLTAAKARIPANEFIVEGFANSPPWWMTKSGSVTGNYNADENLRDDMYDDFADYLVTVAQRARDYWGITFRTLSAFNEPSSAYWYFGNRQEGNRMYPANQEKMIGNLHDLLVQRGLSTRVSAPEETSIDLSRNTINSYSSTTKSKLVQYNTHSYSGSDRVGLNTAAGGKRIWNSEHGDGNVTGETMSRNILWDIKYMKNQAWVYWQAVEGHGSGWGMLETSLEEGGSRSFNLVKKYHTMSQWSKFIRPGFKIIDISDNDSIAAYDSVGKRLIIVTVNDSTSSNSVTYDLSHYTNVGTVTGYRTTYNGSENLAAISGLTMTSKRFTANQPAKSTATYIISNVDGFDGGVIDTSAYYKIVNRNSGKLLDVSAGSIADGGDIIQWSDNGGTNQQWQFVSIGSGYYKIVNRKSSKVMDVSAGSIADGGDIIQWADNGGTNQQWQLVLSGGYYKLVNRKSGKVTDVNASSTADGGDVIQWSDNGGTNQQWQLIKVN
ncbi:RICIN domain-containing protein [Paenibacillus sp. sptzw28]|uniref:RICIN domain-containing protein n=1 Tax=Paenibacillus sp. sptzw28 TaxID=715179 RepID=UPI001C6EF706|nr:RICIN domain-containing protein [Paenibacillus sp. sptzw28]QYR19242.1 RICIN domain-containing protein [Paenibacillus sp. sptzw28]